MTHGTRDDLHPVEIETIEPTEASFDSGLSEAELVAPAALGAGPSEVGPSSETIHQDAAAEDESRVMVGRFQSPSEAQMAKGMLESAGIECFLQGENANAMLPMAFRSRLTVAEGDEPEARALMASAGEPGDVSPDDEDDVLG